AGAAFASLDNARPSPLPFAAAVGAYLIAWALGWTWMAFNSLIGLRQRVRQGWSLIDVELKRRHDLIGPLATIVSTLGAHERDVQTTVSALRAQLAVTKPGMPGPDPEGLASRLRVVAEHYPALVAQKSFAELHAALVETEERIALARGYYNDIATYFATRLERIPDRWVAQLAGMQPEPLLVAENFERAAVSVHLASR
ncbi:MAG: LemA family protein, partial [Opitutaceae bacterium]